MVVATSATANFRNMAVVLSTTVLDRTDERVDRPNADPARNMTGGD
jgi:hypothetical protein